MNPKTSVRTLRRIMRDRRVPDHLVRHARWLVSGVTRTRDRALADGDVIANPVKASLDAAGAAVLHAFGNAGMVAFLVADRGHEVVIGVGDEDRGKATTVIAEMLPGWRLDHSRHELVVTARAAGAGGGHVRVTWWQSNNLGERELVGGRGLHRLLADELFGTTELAGVPVPAIPGFVPEPLRLRPRFEIDAVVTWVDATDQVWAGRKQAAIDATRPDPLSVSPARFRSRDELRYLLRSIDAFAPFFRQVFVVTDCSRPQWLRAETPGLTIVDQTDLLGGQPVFNSLAVETALHHIEGLSEHYVYFNDDMFLARPVDPELFFGPAGTLRLTQGPRIRSGPPRPGEDAFETSAKQSRDLVHRELGWIPERSANHVPLPQRRSLATEMEQRFGADLAETRASTFRSAANVSSATGLVHYLGAELGVVAPSDLTWDYVDTSGRFAASHYAELARGASVDTFCCNDGDDGASGAGVEAKNAALERFLNGYFPTPSRFEIGSR